MRRKCKVCGLYTGARGHTGPMHDRIMAARRGFLGRIRQKVSRRRRRKG